VASFVLKSGLLANFIWVLPGFEMNLTGSLRTKVGFWPKKWALWPFLF
jgi:hypothetical protein